MRIDEHITLGATSDKTPTPVLRHGFERIQGTWFYSVAMVKSDNPPLSLSRRGVSPIGTALRLRFPLLVPSGFFSQGLLQFSVATFVRTKEYRGSVHRILYF